MALPQKTRKYITESLDSSRWEHINFRSDDIIIATAMKVGTTWMERIIGLLIHRDTERIDPSVMNAPWPDARIFEDFKVTLKKIEDIKHRRFFKTHIPLDGLSYQQDVKYIHISRDTRDVFMSMLNHWKLISQFLKENNRSHPPQISTQGTISDMWKRYTNKSVFEWEQDGWPFWSNNSYTESFWNFRNLENILFVHYNDLTDDLEKQVKRIAQFLQITDLTEDLVKKITKASTFESMKKDGNKLIPKYSKVFKGGAEAFLHKGKNGRWKEVFTEDDLELYARMNKRYDRKMIAWIEKGGEYV